jgi:hypothetical protein
MQILSSFWNNKTSQYFGGDACPTSSGLYSYCRVELIFHNHNGSHISDHMILITDRYVDASANVAAMLYVP